MENNFYKSPTEINNILLATDNSNSVASAELFAIELAAYYKCKLYIINVFEKVSYDESNEISYDEYLHQYKHQKQAELQIKFNDIISIKNIICNYVAYEKHNTVSETIAKFSSKNDINFIIAGTHGSSGYKNNSFGSNTLGLINASKTPLFIIPSHSQFKPFDNSAFACKGLKDELEILKWLSICLSITFNKFKLVHISSDDGNIHLWDFEKNIKSMLGENSPTLNYINDTDIEKGLNEFVANNKIDLLVLTGKPKSFFQKLFSPNIVNRLSYKVQLPLLYLPPYV